jgi:hypothetical protein
MGQNLGQLSHKRFLQLTLVLMLRSIRTIALRRYVHLVSFVFNKATVSKTRTRVSFQVASRVSLTVANALGNEKYTRTRLLKIYLQLPLIVR